MVDIHSHLLYGIDDGSKSIEESVTIIEDLKNFGYDALILTPHYIKDSQYNYTRKHNMKLLENLKEAVSKRGISIELYLGNELYIDEDLYELLENGSVSSLNGSNYVLIEIPMSGIHSDYIDIFSFLIANGYKVILAHPERYLSFQKDFSKISELIDCGVLLQCNIGSIVGDYGLGAQKLVKKLFKKKLVSFLGTDIHHRKKDYSSWEKAKKKILKYLTEDEFEKLIESNPRQIIC